MIIEKQLARITEADLQALISSQTKEGKEIEFKREVNLSTPDAKRKFLKGVSALANTQGGHIVFGIDEKDSVATSLHALPNFNEDSDKIKLRDFIRAHIEPKIYGFDFHAVSLSGGGHALVLWIPRSWVGPHMVTFENDNRFYFRHGNGTSLMDVSEIRMAFSVTGQLSERLRQLRLNRLSAISTGDVPLKLQNSRALVFHLVPFSAFDTLYECDLKALVILEKKSLSYLQTTVNAGYTKTLQYDFDGVFKMMDLDHSCLAYTKLIRTGVLEAVDSYCMRESSQIPGVFCAYHYESSLLSTFNNLLDSMLAAKIEPPISVALSLIGVSGKAPFLYDYGIHAARPIRNDPLLIQPVVIDSLDADAYKILVPLFDRVWQASGVERSLSFGSDGKLRQDTHFQHHLNRLLRG
jgi:hypothetical protein